MSLTKTQIVNALQWRMGLINEDSQVKSDWGLIEAWLRGDPQQVEALAAKLSEPLVAAMAWGMMPTSNVRREWPKAATYWSALCQLLNRQADLPNQMAEKAAALIEAEMQQQAAPQPSAPPARQVAEADASRHREMSPATIIPVAAQTQTFLPDEVETVPSNRDVKQETKIDMVNADPGDEPISTGPDNQATANHTTSDPAVVPPAPDAQTTDSQATDSQPRNVAASQWKYFAVPEGPDKHDEYYSSTLVSPEGLKLIGARVRGKKHKHEGTNCDDWFECDVSGPWTIIAVSDGAGSKALSRIGAKKSCRAALSLLSEKLENHRIESLENLSGKSIERDPNDGTFAAADFEHVQLALHDAMYAAYDAVAAAAAECAKDPKYETLIGHPVSIDDLSATLLLAAHTTGRYKDTDLNFVFTCQVGDGMLAAVDRKGGLKLLGVPDSGEFAGQTDFLTSKKKLTREHLWRKTQGFFGPLQALMVMTDGVADDYFPNDPEMLRLYGDLVVNEVITLRGLNPFDHDEALKTTNLPTAEDVRRADFAATVEVVTPGNPRPVTIRSVAEYAKLLGLEVRQVAASPSLLMEAASVGQLCDEKEAEDKLRVWLDSYYVRGSFDDRTLVVLYREVVK